MKFDVVFNVSPGGERRLFVLKFYNGQACIVGDMKEKLGENDASITVVYDAEGNRTAIHPLPENGKCLYEIHMNDFVGVIERDQSTGTLLINLYEVMRFSERLAICSHYIA